jgi:hypothetical protein
LRRTAATRAAAACGSDCGTRAPAVSDLTEEVLSEALAVVRSIEDQSVPLSRVALRARRLAQLIDDDEAFWWLRLECEGHRDPSFPSWSVGDSASVERAVDKFVQLRTIPDLTKLPFDQVPPTKPAGEPFERRTIGLPLAFLEREHELSEEQASRLGSAAQGPNALLLAEILRHDRRSVVNRIAGAIHEWASSVYVTYRFRRAAANIFERFRSNTEAVLARLCPEAINKLNHAVERAASADAEDWSAATLACRRVLKEFADAVYPARTEKVNGRSVGEAEHKNRLWAFAKERGRQELEGQFLAEEEIDGLCKALDKLNDLDSKGIHAEITRAEAEMAVLRTYILLAQLAPLVPPEADGPANDKSQN